uniref:Uncharacterized protein n=1 Tax=Solanum tuberosum TaxID=4113 RepID=M1DIX8_SOLTU
MPGFQSYESPNNDVGVYEMISAITHEIAEVSTNPLVNAWYAGQVPSFPIEIADLCEGIYGTSGGRSYTGQMLNGEDGATYNMNGVRDANGAGRGGCGANPHRPANILTCPAPPHIAKKCVFNPPRPSPQVPALLHPT